MNLFNLCLLTSALCLSACTTVRENGKVVLSTSSDLKGLHFRTPAGTTLDAESIDNSAIHHAVGTGIATGSMGIGAAVMTSGIGALFHR